MFNGRNGVGSLNYNTKEILAILEKNLAQHKADYEQARQNFKIDLVKGLEALADKVKRGEETKENGFSLVVPQSYEKEYLRAIKMLKLCVEEKIELDGQTFSMYVMDEWDWSDRFASSTKVYNR